jgi:enoyl-CoA hydratase/carnithine racemase
MTRRSRPDQNPVGPAAGERTGMFDEISYVEDGAIARITINRPQVRNALNNRAHHEMRAAFESFRDDPRLRVAVLTGRGDQAFCAGADLKEAAAMLAAGEREDGVPPFGGITEDFTCWKPIIAAVNGVALGGGTELVLACDIAVATTEATFGLPEVRHGIVAASGGLVRLPRQLPLKAAMGMILSGRPLSASAALAFGLVNEVVPAGQLANCAQRWAEDILSCSPAAVRMSKEFALSRLHLPVDAALAEQTELVARLTESPDAAEGTRAFTEKRPPRWQVV